MTNKLKYNSKLMLGFFYIAASIIIIFGLKFASEVVVIIFLSIFIAAIVSNFLDYITAKGLNKIFAYILTFLIFITLFLLLIITINNSIFSFISNISYYEVKIKEIIVSNIIYLNSFGFNIDKSTLIENLNINAILSFITTILNKISHFFSKFILITIGVIFILAESKSFEQKLKIIFKNDKNRLSYFKLFTKNIQKYFTAKVFTSFLTGFIITLTLLYLDIKFAVLWGLLAFIFNFIPIIGSILASIPAIILSLIDFNIEITIYVIVLYALINISISNIIEPKIMGDELGLSPMVIFFSLIFWGWVLGIVGMFLAIPITMTLKIAFESTPNARWLGILLSNLSNSKEKRD